LRKIRSIGENPDFCNKNKGFLNRKESYETFLLLHANKKRQECFCSGDADFSGAHKFIIVSTYKFLTMMTHHIQIFDISFEKKPVAMRAAVCF